MKISSLDRLTKIEGRISLIWISHLFRVNTELEKFTVPLVLKSIYHKTATNNMQAKGMVGLYKVLKIPIFIGVLKVEQVLPTSKVKPKECLGLNRLIKASKFLLELTWDKSQS